MPFRSALAALSLIVLLGASSAAAWTGPSAAPPGSNVSAPLNVGTTAQVKNGNIGVNGLAVFGNTLLQGSSYLNFGSTVGASGYGIWDNAGILNFKNSGGAWTPFGSGTSSWTNPARGSGFNYNTLASATAEAGAVKWVDSGTANTNGPSASGNTVGALLQLDPLWSAAPDTYKTQIAGLSYSACWFLNV
jgi:hypothetical protein